jgi:hypothetical protein
MGDKEILEEYRQRGLRIRARRKKLLVPSTILSIIAAAGTLYMLLVYDISYSLTFSVVGVLWIVVGTALDMYTTYRIDQLKPEFAKRGLPFPALELNPTMPETLTLRDLFSPRRLLLHLSFFVCSFIVPPLGLMLGTGHTVMAIRNQTTRKLLLSYL